MLCRLPTSTPLPRMSAYCAVPLAHPARCTRILRDKSRHSTHQCAGSRRLSAPQIRSIPLSAVALPTEKGCLLMKSGPQIPGREGRLAFSINEVCASTNLGRDAVYRAISTGQLVARKLGKRTVVTSRDLEHFLQSLPKAGATA